MKHFLFSLSLLAIFISSKAHTDSKLFIGTVDSIQSTLLNEKRKICVYMLRSLSDDHLAKKQYPVV